MEAQAGTPPSNAGIALSTQAKLGFDEVGESQQKPQQEQHQLQPQQDARHALSPSIGATKSGQATMEEFRRLSLSPALSARLSPVPHGPYIPLQEQSSLPPPSSLKRFWIRNKYAALVAISQLFGALMNLSARLLELEGDGMHPFQILLMRQSLTSICCFAYMWYMNVPGFPLGGKEIRWLMLVRGLSGFL